MLPNFLIIGAPKCGTTTLCHLLGQHPDVFMCTPKEPAFFSRENVYQRGLTWYESLFENARGKSLVGEGTTGYSTSLTGAIAAARIAQHLPDARLIYCVRHPVRRIESIWMDYASWGAFGYREGRKIRLFRDFSASVRSNPAFVETSCYWARLNVYRGRFPDRQIHIVFLEDLEMRPEKTLADCFRFLGCDPDLASADAGKRLNVSERKSIPTPLGAVLRYLPQRKPVRWLRRTLTSLVPSIIERPLLRPVWDPELLQDVTERLRDDARTLLAHCSKPADFWDLSQGASLSNRCHSA